MKKIKLLKTVTDGKKGGDILIGSVVDLGQARNEAAVKGKLAVWVDSTEFETAKKELAAEKQTEKKEGTPKKTTTTVKGKKIQTK